MWEWNISAASGKRGLYLLWSRIPLRSVRLVLSLTWTSKFIWWNTGAIRDVRDCGRCKSNLYLYFMIQQFNFMVHLSLISSENMFHRPYHLKRPRDGCCATDGRFLLPARLLLPSRHRLRCQVRLSCCHLRSCQKVFIYIFFWTYAQEIRKLVSTSSRTDYATNPSTSLRTCVYSDILNFILVGQQIKRTANIDRNLKSSYLQFTYIVRIPQICVDKVVL